MKRNLRQTLEIRDNVSDPKLKLHAADIANDCYKYILDMSTKCRDIIRCFEVRYKKTETIQKLDERIEETEEETFQMEAAQIQQKRLLVDANHP